MALAGGMSASTRQPSPGSINFSSNNPFRNRISPLPSPSSLEAPAPNLRDNRLSRNPFLDANGIVSTSERPSTNHAAAMAAADAFGDLSLNDQPSSNKNHPPPPPYSRPPRNGPPPMSSRPGPGPPSPARREAKPTHQRRNSESSIMERDRAARRERERSERPPRTESEERRRRERRREREERHRREKNKRPQRGLDIIDKLDVTGVYGQGVFHHDGPFDACNPHRNVKKDKRAPMQAFPVGSANMALGGNGPLSSRLDLDRIHGRGTEGFSDYASTRKADTSNIINPTDRVVQVHGQETYGLGTSTFLDGAPAPRSALQRRESQEAGGQDGPSSAGGLQRKKSLAQRLRGMSSTRRERPDLQRSPEARYYISSSNKNSSSAIADGGSPPLERAISGGSGVGRAKYVNDNEINPFDSEYNSAFDKKGAQIRVVEQQQQQTANQATSPLEGPSSRAPNAPNTPKLGPSPPLRGKPDDSALLRSPDEEKPGLLSRMKSLRGGRRARPERRESDS